MNLIEIVVDQIVFLATAADSEVDPDVAVKQLESLMGGLHELDEPQREAMRANVMARLERTNRSDVHEALTVILDDLA